MKKCFHQTENFEVESTLNNIKKGIEGLYSAKRGINQIKEGQGEFKDRLFKIQP